MPEEGLNPRHADYDQSRFGFTASFAAFRVTKVDISAWRVWSSRGRELSVVNRHR